MKHFAHCCAIVGNMMEGHLKPTPNYYDDFSSYCDDVDVPLNRNPSQNWILNERMTLIGRMKKMKIQIGRRNRMWNQNPNFYACDVDVSDV